MANKGYDINGNPLAQPVNEDYANNQTRSYAIPHVEAKKPKQEIPTGFRDLPFAILFILNVLTIIGLVVAYGIDAIKGTKSSDSSGSNHTTSDSYLSKDESLNILAIGLVMCALAAVISIFLIKLMVQYASSLIKFALWFQVSMSVLMAVLGFVTGSFGLALIGIIFAAIGICYARAVRHRIPFATANLRVASSAIKKHGSTYGVAFLFLIVQIIWVVIWSLCFVGVIDHTNKTTSSNITNKYCNYDSQCSSGYCNSNGRCVDNPQTISYVAYFFLLLSLYWGVSVFRNVTHCTTAGTVATWWYSSESAGATGASLRRSLTTSFGSICLGSLLVAILNTLKQLADNSSRDGNWLACIAACLLGCFESLLEYFNRWAYIYVAIYGYKYTVAGKAVFDLFKARGFDAIINDNLIQNVLGFTSIAVGILCAGIAIGIYHIHKSMLSTSDASVILGILGFVIGASISAIPLSVIDSSVATIFVCFAEDPVSFAISHPEEYTPLINAWNRMFPDILLSNGYYA